MDMNIINTALWSNGCANHLCFCGCDKVVYVNYWLEFSQCKLIGQFKAYYSNSARPSLTFYETTVRESVAC